MNSLDTASFFANSSPEINLHILSMLDIKSLQHLASVSKQFNELAQDHLLWKDKTRAEFGIVGTEAKQENKEWKKTYNELESSRDNRINNIGKVIQSQIQKNKTDDIQYRTNMEAARLFGFAAPNAATHYYPTGRTFYAYGRKFSIYGSSTQQ